jgi:hypothetical protein
MSDTSDAAQGSDELDIIEIETDAVAEDGTTVRDDLVAAVDGDGNVLATDETVTVVGSDGTIVVDETIAVMGEDGELHVVDEELVVLEPEAEPDA